MDTRPKYYEDPYAHELEATVKTIRKADKCYEITLDQTIFYPEGGGQPGDRGKIGDAVIFDTQKKDGEIVHLTLDPAGLTEGAKVRTELDWAHRYSYMVSHTAQHLLSGLLFRDFSIGTVSVHFGDEILTIETNSESIPDSVLHKLEDTVNDSILNGAPVKYLIKTHKEAEEMGLRRTLKVSSETVRLVQIGDIDVIGCGGVHVADAREIKRVSYVGQEKIRGHVRTLWRSGDSAKDEIRRNRAIVAEAGALLSAQPETLIEVLSSKLQKETELRGDVMRLEAALAEQLVKTDSPVLDLSEIPVPLAAIGKAAGDIGRGSLAAVKEASGKLQWLIFGPELDFQAIKSNLLPIINAKGGGRPPLYQGVGEPSGKEAFLNAFREFVNKEN